VGQDIESILEYVDYSSQVYSSHRLASKSMHLFTGRLHSDIVNAVRVLDIQRS